MEVTLGFLRSQAVAKNLCFNTHALSQLLGEPNRLSFKDVKVERLRVQISNWSFPAFTIEVHGLHVTLAVGYAIASLTLLLSLIPNLVVLCF